MDSIKKNCIYYLLKTEPEILKIFELSLKSLKFNSTMDSFDITVFITKELFDQANRYLETEVQRQINYFIVNEDENIDTQIAEYKDKNKDIYEQFIYLDTYSVIREWNDPESPITYFSPSPDTYQKMLDYFEGLIKKTDGYPSQELIDTFDIVGNKYSWGGGYVEIKRGLNSVYRVKTPWSDWDEGFVGLPRNQVVFLKWYEFDHYVKFNKDFTKFVSIRVSPRDFLYCEGSLIDERFLHIYGDSHALVSFEGLTIPHRNLFEFGITMHRVGRDQDIIHFKDTHNNKQRIFCLNYGEMDVRCHIGKQVIKGRAWEEVCDVLVTNYFASIRKNIKEYKAIIIVAIIPPTDVNDHTHANNLPFIGTNSERVEYTNRINELLEKGCEQYGYIYFNPYTFYRREDGCLKHELSDTSIHIGKNSEFLREFCELYNKV